jgi:hypothetical protein
MESPWQIPLPLERYTTNQVAVYFYSDTWIPITFSTLADAISLHRQALSSGKEFVVFPPDLDPRAFDAPATQPYWPRRSRNSTLLG